MTLVAATAPTALQAVPAWLALGAAGAAYAWGVRRAGRWPRARSVAFAAALAALALALAPGLDAAAEQRLSLHMVQHLLISLVAAPLAVWSAPVRLLLGAQRPRARRRTARALHAAPLRALAHPLVGLTLFAGVAAGAHVPALYEAALRDPVLHGAEHAAFFWSAIALWIPLIAADPVPRRVGAIGRVGVLMAAMAAMAAAGGWLAGAQTVLYDSYRAPAARLGIDPLADQGTAGGVMWIGGMALIAPLLLALAWRALADEERRQLVRDEREGGAR